MLKISDEKVIYSFHANNPCTAEAKAGDRVQFVTKDCFSNQIQCEKDRFDSVGWGTINPATGPLKVTGAEKGDTLVVHIDNIEIAEQGTMIIAPGMGAFGEMLESSETRIVKIEKGKVLFNKDIELPIKPMIGVIGTAPEGEDIPCGTPGRHGGNMDTKLITAGSTLYLPVFVEGAKLAMGDLHAVMGDGEVSICGVEVPGVVTVTLDLVRGKQEVWPVLETQDAWYVIASAEDLDKAAQLAMEAMLVFLQKRTPLSKNDIVSLLSIAGDLQISQVVDPLKTVRMRMRKDILSKYSLGF